MNPLFKRILKILLILTTVIIVLVGISLFLLSKPINAPLEQYDTQSETDFYNDLDDELTGLILDSEEDRIHLTIDESFINRVIQKKLTQENTSFLDDTYIDDIGYSYMSVFANHIGFKGIWTTLIDNQIIVTAGADYVNSNGRALYQTGLEITFDIILSEDNQYYLEVNHIEIGRINLSNKSAYALSNFIIKTLTDSSINDLIVENLTFGYFDSEELSFTVGESELANYLYEIDPTFSALLRVIYEEELLILDVSDEGFNVSLEIGVFRRLITDVDEPTYISWGEEADKILFMFNLATNAAFNFGLNPINPKIDLSESDVNSILEYTLGEDVQFDIPINFIIGDQDVEYSFSSTDLFIRMDGSVLSIHLKMTLSKTGVSETFDMQFNLNSTVSMNANGDMELSIIDANIGDVILDDEILGILIGVFSDTLYVDNTIIVKKEKLNEMFEGSNIVINDMIVSNGELELYYGLDN